MLRTFYQLSVSFVLVMCLSACSLPVLEGQPSNTQVVDVCNTTLSSAEKNSDNSQTLPFAFMQAIVAQNATSQWLNTATTCPQFYNTAVIRAAQSMYTQKILADKLGVTPAFSPIFRLDNVKALSLDDLNAQHIMLATDRAGFALEVIAGKKTDLSLLSLSDNLRTVSNQVLTITQLSKDPRQKIYDANTIMNNVDSMIDPSTHLLAPTVSIIEINCVRESLASINFSKNAFAKNSLDQNTGMKQLALLLASYMYDAFTRGYPSGDFALLHQ
ncbi:MAG: hypothetical protein Q3961_01425 [Bifidobacteriaceae bacterium]|nr:hypothetical protein [Bifidobacteriaceae bacterium]